MSRLFTGGYNRTTVCQKKDFSDEIAYMLAKSYDSFGGYNIVNYVDGGYSSEHLPDSWVVT